MTNWIKQSTSVVISFGPFLDKTDGVTEETGLVSALDHASTGIKLSKNGGAMTIRHATVTATTYDAYGMYRVTLDTTDTNTLGTLRMAFNEAATCLPVWQDFMVLPANIYDSLVGGSDVLDVSMTQILGTAVATPATAGVLDVNVKNAGNVAWDSGAITAGVIAADAIGASELAADAVAEIADAVWDEARAGHVAAGSFGENVIADITKIGGNAASISPTAGLLNARLTEISVAATIMLGNIANANTVSGVTNPVTVGAINNNVITAASLDATAAAEFAARILDGENLDTGLTVRHGLELAAASVLQKLTGAGTGTEKVRNFSDTADLATVTVDGNGNKSAVIYDFSI